MFLDYVYCTACTHGCTAFFQFYNIVTLVLIFNLGSIFILSVGVTYFLTATY